MAMSFSNKVYVYSNVKVELSSFTTGEGAAEYHAMLHVLATDDDFAEQLASIEAAYFYLLSSFGGAAHPVFRRYFLSDAANQAGELQARMRDFPPCAVSVVQQPPLDGTKIALWVYLTEGIEVAATDDGVVAGRNGYRHLWTAGLRTPQGDSQAQTRTLLDRYTARLESEGCRLADHCIRTWFFVQNVDVNYEGVVLARKAFFEAQGMTEATHYLASTGIEGRDADPQVSVRLDAYAVRGLAPGQQRYLYAPTHLNPTYEYGVTFERGVCVDYGDREQLYISGTASIDNRGGIVAPGDIAGQTARMLENIGALLAEAGAGMADIAQMIVYLRDAADYRTVARIFDERFPHTPRVITLAPVCRPGWLIETECIALRECRNPQFQPF